MRTPTWLAIPVLSALLPAACGGAVESSTNSGPSASSGSSSGGGNSSSSSSTGGYGDKCVPRAAPRFGSTSVYGREALPTGACAGGATCELLVSDCACGNYPIDNYACACAGGTWSCRLKDQGASVCSCPPPTGSGTGPTGCVYPPVHNDPRCPSSYSSGYRGIGCAPVGLTCAYPGVGDPDGKGCLSTAMMWCTGPSGVGDLDAGPDGSTAAGRWVTAQ